MSIASAAGQAGLSTRQLDRYFDRWLGLPPKTVCRIARFRAAWSMGFASPGLDWATIALECGYADQAHLCREFREFSGVTPRQSRLFG